MGAQQIAGWLQAHPGRAYQVSHETIYRSLSFRPAGAEELLAIFDRRTIRRSTGASMR